MHRDPPMWREFNDLLAGLLASTESRLWRAVTPTPDEPQTLGGVDQ